MASVDDRIVQMQFDNTAFEKKLETTLKSLADLEKALKFENAKQGLSDLNGIGDKFNLGSMATHIEGASAKFLALGSIAFTVLSNITTQAMHAGAQIVKSLSLDLVISGFKEYELNINSIQTILSNTKADGTNLQDVTAALDELNEYADKTIYNFGQMTKNIGTFTAAGVDLETSVSSIKGISNVAAISGASAEQAANAMYQLSQAVSTGSLKLMDWNSVVNAGMGGEVLQKALFETGKAMGTLKDVPLTQTFDQWKEAGNSFRGSLEKEWITADVLTTTLKGFTGEMTEAQLLTIGYTKAQAAEIIELGKTGVDAATKIRTLTGLINTTKESIGSGWAESFRIIVGGFDEATTLFSGISGTISNVVKNSADARNKLLQGWKDLGGRDLLIEGLRTAVQNFGEILAPIGAAFREIFPKTTMFQLMDLTKAFELLVIKMRPSKETVQNIHDAFKGFFSVLQIGWVILKEGVKFFAQLFDEITGAGSGKFLGFIGTIGNFFTTLNNKLVEGEGIKKFFLTLLTHAEAALSKISKLKEVIVDFFDGLVDSAAADVATTAVDRISSRFDNLGQIFDRLSGLWGPLGDALEKITGVLDNVWSAISNWFEDLGRKLAEVIEPGDFDAVVDAVNVGLLGAIALLLKKFLDKGIKLDLGGGLLESIKDTFGGLTGVLSAMQTQLKAGALEKIAIAIALLTASVFVLSLIDSAAMTRALTAMAVGFGELMATFAILSKMSMGPKGAATFGIVATGMILLAGAMVILATSLKIISTMSWDELTKGLVGFTAILAVVVAAVIPLSSMSSGMIAAGIGLTGLGVAMNLLAVALKIFATMSWAEIGKGLATVVGLLVAIVAAVNLMPTNMALTGPALIAIAASLVILGAAMKIFATLSWEEIGKGLATIAGALVAIGLAMNLMPPNLPITAGGLVLVGISLNAIAAAMKLMGGMSWKEIAKGLAAMAGSLIILAVATNAMTGSIAGAVAIGIVSGALVVLAMVLKEFAKITWDDLIHGLVGIAATFAVLGLAALALQSAIPALLGFGAALVLIGGGFALFGAGVALVAKGLELIAKTGSAAAKVIPDLLKALSVGLPAFMKTIAEGFIEMALTIADAAPVLVEALVVVLNHILDGLIELIPKALTVIGELISGIIEFIGKDGVPKIIQAGLDIILALLTGIRDNIDQVVTLAVDIITNFIDALAREVPRVIDSVTNLFVEIFLGVAEALGRTAGRLLFGVGAAFIQGFMDGISESAESGPIKWFKELAGNVIGWIGNVLRTLWNKGIELIGGLANGITEKVTEVKNFFTNLPGNIIEWIGDTATDLKDKGIGFIKGLAEGISERFTDLLDWIKGLPRKIINGIPNPLDILFDVGKKILQGLWDGMVEIWNKVTGWLGGLADKIKDTKGPPAEDKTMLVENGKLIMQGLQKGMEDEWDQVSKWLSEINPADFMDFNNIDMGANLGNISEFQPTITPVLDLTEVKTAAQRISDYISETQSIPVSASYQQAQRIASGATVLQQPQTPETQGQPSGVNFEQNIYAPSQLSTSDIYKQTRNQITMAKEELKIP